MTAMDRFVPQYFDQGEAPFEEGSETSPRDFELTEFDIHPTEQKRTFSFDNEIQRNYDPSNVSAARESVIDVFRDAMERIKEQARQTREDAHKEGYQEGHQEGFKEGEQAAREDFAPFLETLQGLVRDLSDFRAAMYTKVEHEMIDMIVQLTKKVILTELASREDSIQDVLRLAVRSVLDRERMVIKVNPRDKIHAESYRPELHHLFSEIKNITFEAQPSIARGGCIVESNFGTVDAQTHHLQEQIDRILGIAPPPPAAAAMPAAPLTEESEENNEENPSGENAPPASGATDTGETGTPDTAEPADAGAPPENPPQDDEAAP